MNFPFIPGAPAVFGPFGAGDNRYAARLKRRKEVIANLCAALQEFLSAGLDQDIEEAERPIPRPPRPTLEDLNRAQEDLDAAEKSLAGLERLAEKMPNEMGAAYLDSQRPQLERMIQPMRERVARIQELMEQPEPDPSNPWNGSIHIDVLCATCAKASRYGETSPTALNARLKADGWRRNSEGDHICPDCAARVNAQAPEADGVRVSPTAKGDGK